MICPKQPGGNLWRTKTKFCTLCIISHLFRFQETIFFPKHFKSLNVAELFSLMPQFGSIFYSVIFILQVVSNLDLQSHLISWKVKTWLIIASTTLLSYLFVRRQKNQEYCQSACFCLKTSFHLLIPSIMSTCFLWDRRDHIYLELANIVWISSGIEREVICHEE